MAYPDAAHKKKTVNIYALCITALVHKYHMATLWCHHSHVLFQSSTSRLLKYINWARLFHPIAYFYIFLVRNILEFIAVKRSKSSIYFALPSIMCACVYRIELFMEKKTKVLSISNTFYEHSHISAARSFPICRFISSIFCSAIVMCIVLRVEVDDYDCINFIIICSTSTRAARGSSWRTISHLRKTFGTFRIANIFRGRNIYT